MALTFPIALASLFETLLIESIRFSLPEAMEVNRTAGGEVLTADMGARLWTGEVTIVKRGHSDQLAVEAILAILRQAGRSFYVNDPRRPYPEYDPTGSILGAGTPTISTFNANNRDITVSGLPASYQVRRGDYLSFTYSTGPERQAFHQVVTGVTANGSGVAANIEVTPSIRPGATNGASVLFKKPVCKAVYLPGSYQASVGSGVLSGGMSFGFVQTLR